MIGEVCSNGRRGRCFSGCRGADELVRIFDPQFYSKQNFSISFSATLVTDIKN